MFYKRHSGRSLPPAAQIKGGTVYVRYAASVIRRITGYLVGTMDKWNDAKKAEERDRVKHGTKL